MVRSRICRRAVAGQRSAFTLIELLLVMVILTILATVVASRFTGISEKGNVTAAKAQIDAFRLSLKMFDAENGRFPTTSEGLQALVSNPGNLPNWKPGGYLDKTTIPNDPWGRPYVYQWPGSNDADYDLYSLGADGQQHVEP